MTRPLTDRERALKAEARVAELEDELAAWKAYGGAAAPDADDATRRFGASRWLRARDRRAGTPACVSILLALLARPGQVVSREALMRATRAPDADVDDTPETKVVDVQIVGVRRALASVGVEIQTVWGVGFRIPEADAETAEGLILGGGA